MRGNGSAGILIAVDPFAGGEPAAVWVAADQGFGSVSTLDGWLPLTIQLVAGLALVLAIVRFSRRWWLQWMPIVAAAAILTALATARATRNSRRAAALIWRQDRQRPSS